MSEIDLSQVATATLDLDQCSVREVNRALHTVDGPVRVTVRNPAGRHSIAVGIGRSMRVDIEGHVGYYCAGMNQRGEVAIHGNAGVGVAENMMSGIVRVHGDASQAAGATAHGGLLAIDGNAAARCGISMKGVDIVVGGDVGHMSAFMAQAGRLVICGDAGDALGDSLYETRIYLRGAVKSLGADCIEKPMNEEHLAELHALLEAAGRSEDPRDFRRLGSARQLYHFQSENSGAY